MSEQPTADPEVSAEALAEELYFCLSYPDELYWLRFAALCTTVRTLPPAEWAETARLFAQRVKRSWWRGEPEVLAFLTVLGRPAPDLDADHPTTEEVSHA